MLLFKRFFQENFRFKKIIVFQVGTDVSVKKKTFLTSIFNDRKLNYSDTPSILC